MLYASLVPNTAPLPRTRRGEADRDRGSEAAGDGLPPDPATAPDSSNSASPHDSPARLTRTGRRSPSAPWRTPGTITVPAQMLGDASPGSIDLSVNSKSDGSGRTQEVSMAKGYWVSVYRTISDPERLTAYDKLAGPAVRAGGGRTLSRGGRVVTHEA